MDILAYYKREKKYVTNLILRIFLEIPSYWKEKSFDITTNTIPYKNGNEWFIYECPSEIINFRCLLLKTFQNALFGIGNSP